MSQENVVSVCMITYNHENYIKQSVLGVLNQITDYELEIIVVDDCSTDNTYELLKGLAQNNLGRLKVFKNEKNLGIIGNFIQAISKCTGEYIAICEGDDYWSDNNKIQSQVDILKASNTLSFVHTKFDLIGHSTSIRRLEDYESRNISPPCGLTDMEYFLKNRNIKNSTILFNIRHKQEIIDCLKVIRNNIHSYDHIVFTILLNNGYGYFLNSPTTVYRVYENSVSERFTKAENNARIYAMLYIQIKSKNKLLSKSFIKVRLTRYLRNKAANLQIKKLMELFLVSIRYYLSRP